MGNNENCDSCADAKRCKLEQVIAENKDKRGSLIQVLHEAQDIYGYLPMPVQKIVAEGMKIPLAEVYGVVTFYSRFTLTPKGKNKISVCLGTACYVKGSNLILDKLKEELGLDVGDCSVDGEFSLDACRCVGACGLAPVFLVNEDVYGRVGPEEVPGIINKYKGN